MAKTPPCPATLQGYVLICFVFMLKVKTNSQDTIYKPSKYIYIFLCVYINIYMHLHFKYLIKEGPIILMRGLHSKVFQKIYM